MHEEFGEVDGSGFVLEVIGEGDWFTDACGDAAEAAVDGEGFSGADLAGGGDPLFGFSVFSFLALSF